MRPTGLPAPAYPLSLLPHPPPSGPQYGIWSRRAFDTFLTQPEVGIFLNLHKGCTTDGSKAAYNPVTWRNPVLLNAHALLLSEPAYPKDQVPARIKHVPQRGGSQPPAGKGCGGMG